MGLGSLPKLLVLEDADGERLLIHAALGGFAALTVLGSASEAIQAAATSRYDLFLLDIGLPESDGFRVLSEIRKTPQNSLAPVIFLSGRADIAAKLAAFSLGAIDYVLKPFDPLELRARVQAHLGIAQRSERRLGNLVVDGLSSRAYRIDAQGLRADLSLTPMEYRIVARLIRSPGEALSREALLNEIHAESDASGMDRAIDKHMSRLRQKLRGAHVLIESVSRAGYTLKEVQSAH